MAPHSSNVSEYTGSDVGLAWQPEEDNMSVDGQMQSAQQEYMHAIMATTEYKASFTLKTYVPPTLLVLGTLGNLLALAVLLQRHLRLQHSACFYLLVLVGVNTLVLYMGCGLHWLCFISNIRHINVLADWLCKVWQFLFNTLQYSSCWLVVLLAIDRFIFVWYPLKAPYICTVFTAKLLTVAIYIGIGVVCIHTMWIFELHPEHGCWIDNQQRDFEAVAWPWVLATICSYVPLILTFVFLIFLVVGICSCTNCSRNSTSDANQLQVHFLQLSVCLCVLHLLCNSPRVIINFLEYFQHATTIQETARLSFLGREVASEANCFFLSTTFLFYFLLVPTLRREILTLCLRHSVTVTGSEHTPLSSQRRVSVEEIEPNPRGKLLLSVSTTNQESSQSTFV